MEPPPPGAWSNLQLEQWASSAVGVYNSHLEEYNGHMKEYSSLAREHGSVVDRLASLEQLISGLQRSNNTLEEHVHHLDAKVSQYGKLFGPAHLALVAGEVWNWAAGLQFWAADSPDPNATPEAGKFSRITDPQKLYEILNCAARLRYRDGACTSEQLMRAADFCIDMRNRRHHFRSADHLADAVACALQFLQRHLDLYSDSSLADPIWTLENFQIIREEFGF